MDQQSIILFRRLCDELPFITEFDRNEFGEFGPEELEIEAITEKAALINSYWIPKSQMRTDEDNLYIAGWLCDKVRK
jgi:hypothetical protein